MARGHTRDHHDTTHHSRVIERAGLLDLPEVNVVMFAFLFNFVWEFWQVPFYQDVPSSQHWQATKVCSIASVTDGAIMLVSFWIAAVVAGTRAWVLEPAAVELALFTGAGVMVTVIGEWLATEILGWWAYADRMPVLPLLGTGLLPLLQWTILPPLVVWFVRRQLSGISSRS